MKCTSLFWTVEGSNVLQLKRATTDWEALCLRCNSAPAFPLYLMNAHIIRSVNVVYSRTHCGMTSFSHVIICYMASFNLNWKVKRYLWVTMEKRQKKTTLDEFKSCFELLAANKVWIYCVRGTGRCILYTGSEPVKLFPPVFNKQSSGSSSMTVC